MTGPVADPFGLQNKLGINYETLQAARQVVERVWQGHPKYPTHLKTAAEQDRIIASLGPVAIEKMIKALTDTGHRTPQKFMFLDHRGEPMK